MCADRLETVTDSLVGDIVVAGPREAVEKRARTDGQPRVVGIGDADRFGDAVRDDGVAVVAIDGSSIAADSMRRVADGTEGFVVAVFGLTAEQRVDPSLLEKVREAVDVTLLACRTGPPDGSRDERGDSRSRRSRSEAAVGGAFDFVRMLRRPGHVNLDLADARTVCTDGSLAVLSGGTAPLEAGGPGTAVRRTFEEIPAPIDAARGSNALVSVAGGPEMSIGDAIAAVRAVRREVGDVGELIWGVAVEDALADRVTVDVVVDDVPYRPPLSAGDPCRRCGAALAEYTLGERTTLACEACGFADLSMSLDDRPGHDASR
jgi:hypothetical protein